MRRILLGALFLAAATAAAAAGYDASWYRAQGWSGEYPDGFTMAADATVNIRAEPDRDLPASIACAFRKNATYHQWNAARVTADKLEFVSYSKIVDYEVSDEIVTTLAPDSDEPEAEVTLAAGERWQYLAYVAEGMILLRYKDKTWFGGQDLFESSKALNEDDESDSVDEWMKVTCANGATGWLLLADVLDNPAFGSANLTDYGTALDAGPVAKN